MIDIWLVYAGEYENRQPIASFITEELAEKFAKGREVETLPLYERIPKRWRYWHKGAAVYPDGIVEEWLESHWGEGERNIREVDAHLNEGRIWDGHSQGHCGEHISIFGTNKKKVLAAYVKYLAIALARQDGVCHNGNHEGAVDGKEFYKTSFWGRYRRRGEREEKELSCSNSFEHNWGDWIANSPAYSYRICKRCSAVGMLLTAEPVEST